MLILFLAVFPMIAWPNETPSRRDINAVLRSHDQELLKLPGVVGVCVALLPDNKTPCLKVLLSQSNSKTQQALPKLLEGYPVVVEITGEIRPMN
jgi:hypothetical protein